jgi:predicted ATP-grasp superfamily ATP-dependent carboligase
MRATRQVGDARLAPAVVVGGERACGLGLVRSLAAGRMPIYVVDSDRRQPAMRSRYAEPVTVAQLSGRQLVDDLLRLAGRCREKPVLFLSSDEHVVTASQFRSDLSPAYRFQLPPHDLLIPLMSKPGFQAFAEERGLPVPRSVTIDAETDLAKLSSLAYPAVIKPGIKTKAYYERGFARGYRVGSPPEAEQICRDILAIGVGVIVQEWIEGPDTELYFCLQYRHRARGEVRSFTGRKLSIWPPDVGVTSCCTAASEVSHILEPLAEAFFSAIDFDGLGSMEFKRDVRSGEFLMVEPTLARPDWQEEIATLNGVNLPLAAYLSMSGEPSPEFATPPVAAIWCSSWRNSRYDEVAYKGLRKYDAYWRAEDPLPALGYATLSAQPVLRKIGRAIAAALYFGP